MLSFAIAAFVQAANPPLVINMERHFSGPMRYCGNAFSIDIAAGETVTWRRPAADFELHYVEGRGRAVGIYEGRFPDVERDAVRENVDVPPFERVRRVREADGVSYLISNSHGWPPVIHVFGEAWRGDESDLQRLSSIRLRRTDDRGCDGPSVPWADKNDLERWIVR